MIVVFLGPTLPVAEARAQLDADYRGPAAVGDVFEAVEGGARAIGLVDGLFERTPAVWHKEILWALDRGVRVVGSSSMGALRAAELYSFGMEGVGRIFELYRDGAIEQDDAVAVVHGPADQGWRPLSEPLVNLEHGLDLALGRGLIARETRDSLRGWARALFYADRSWPHLLALGREHAVAAEELQALSDFVRSEKPNLKREDAIALLSVLARGSEGPPRLAFEFEPTVFFLELARVVRERREGGAASTRDASVGRYARAAFPRRDDARRDALHMQLLAAEGRRLGVEVSPAQANAASARFRRRRGLMTAAATHAWLEARGLSHVEFSEAMRLEALAEGIHSAGSGAFDDRLVLALKLRGDFPEVASEVAARATWLEARGLATPSLSEAGVTEAELHAWYEARFGPVDGTWEGHARSLGFRSYRDFAIEILGSFLFERDANR